MNKKLAIAAAVTVASVGGATILTANKAAADSPSQVYLPASIYSWRIYPVTGGYSAGSEVGYLHGNEEFPVIGELSPGLYEINVPEYGDVVLWAGGSRLAQVEAASPAAPPAPTPTPAPAPAAAPAAPVSPPAPAPAPAPAATPDVYMSQIFAKESGNNPEAVNPTSGACGLGQALPCSKLLAVCGSLSNVSCQVTFFTNYAIGKYGSTAAAWSFWQSNSWY